MQGLSVRPNPAKGSPPPAQSENPDSPEATFTTGTLSCTCTGTMLFFMGSKSPITPLLSWRGGAGQFSASPACLIPARSSFADTPQRCVVKGTGAR